MTNPETVRAIQEIVPSVQQFSSEVRLVYTPKCEPTKLFL